MDNTPLFNELLKLLDYFDSICKKHNLKYTLIAGSLLGAVRHKGFIPWDDDLDVAMPRNDYDKLLKIPGEEFEYPFFLQTPATDKGYHKRFAKLRNSLTTEIPYKDAVFNYNHGIFLDILPLDAIPDNENDFKKITKRLSDTTRILHYVARVNGGIGTKGLSSKKKIAYYAVWPLVKTGIITSSRLFDRCNKIASSYEEKPHKKIGIFILTLRNKRFIFDVDDFTEYITMRFEDKEYIVPKNYDKILTTSYGDYMTPVHQKSEHGDTIVDVNTPYLEYVAAHQTDLMQLFAEANKKYE